MLTPASAAPAAATLPLFLPQAPPDKVSGLIHAATLLAQLLGQGRPGGEWSRPEPGCKGAG
jgi:hypothetical protein